MIRGFVKLKKLKNPRKTRIGQTPPTHPPIQFEEEKLETIGNMKTTQKTQHFQKICFFNLTKPLTGNRRIKIISPESILLVMVKLFTRSASDNKPLLYISFLKNIAGINLPLPIKNIGNAG